MQQAEGWSAEPLKTGSDCGQVAASEPFGQTLCFYTRVRGAGRNQQEGWRRRVGHMLRMRLMSERLSPVPWPVGLMTGPVLVCTLLALLMGVKWS